MAKKLTKKQRRKRKKQAKRFAEMLAHGVIIRSIFRIVDEMKKPDAVRRKN